MCRVSVIVPVYNVENYIEDMLLSVRKQTFQDFEVLLINDGSTDDSQRIIDGFCREDKRFRSFKKTNGGVASARNLGIEKAEGRYVAFYDPDDYIPSNSLEKMYHTADANNADMVIGVMVEKSLGESLIYMHSQKLAKQKLISPLDEHFFGAWSLCNKMFSLEFIRKNNLRVENMSNAEDGVFTFCALNHAEKICGCDVVAYNYIKRPFWLTPSATQIISSKYLDGLLDSHDRILEEVEKMADRYLSTAGKKAYLEPLYIRFIEGEMINGYYRGIWRSEEDLTERLTKRTEKYRRNISDRKWQLLLRRHEDIAFSKGFLNMSSIAADPTVSIILSADVSDEKCDMILGSIYNQLFPMFEVIVTEEIYKNLPEIYRNKLNLRAVANPEYSGTAAFKNMAFGDSKGEFIIFIDDFVMFTKNSLKNMVNRLLKSEELEFVAMLLKNYDGKNFTQIPCLSAAYGYAGRGKRGYSRLTECDVFISNKLFRKNALQDFTFSAESAEDVKKLYKTLVFEKIRKGVMITDMTQQSILEKTDNNMSAFRIKMGYTKNEIIRKFIERLKRHITKEDINRIKKKLGR